MYRLILLCVVWMALSAATAYFADIWGRKLGKQRKTLFGWRPKKTAVFIITSSGALIALLSFAVLLTADAGIRSALLQWDQTVEQLDQTRAEAKALMAQSEELIVRNKGLLAQNQTTQAQYAKNLSELQATQAALKKQDRQVEASRRELSTVQSSLQAKQTDLTRTTERLTTARSKLDKAQKNLERTREELNRMEKMVAKAEEAAFKAGAEALRESRNAYEARRAAEQAMLGKLLARRDDELVRRVVAPQRTMAAAREEVAKALLDAGLEVQRRSKERNVPYAENKKFVQIAGKVFRSPESGQVLRVTEQQIRDAVASQLMTPSSPQPGGVVLQVVSVTNALAGETVLVDFRLFENHVVFTKGTEVARVVIQRGESKEGIVRSITGALQESRERAVRNGLMPDKDNTVSAVPLSQIADVYMLVLDRMNDHGQDRVPVRVVAARDAWTAGPLDVKMEVQAFEGEG